MKKRILAIVTVVFLTTGSIFAQATLTDVINEFNAGVESLNGQSYESALSQFNNCLAMCEEVGTEAEDMKIQAQDQIVGTYYRQAMTMMKRKQYDLAIPFLESTVEASTTYNAKPEYAEKALKYLPPLYLREGNIQLKQENFEDAIKTFDKALVLEEGLYKAHQGKGLVYKELQDIEKMLEEFAIAKQQASENNDQEAIDEMNNTINSYYKDLIKSEFDMIDPEEPDYTFLVDLCDQAIEANDKNSFARWHAAKAKNEMVEYDAAIEYAEPAVEYETDPVLLSALYYELGIAYTNTVRYKEACEAFKKVTEEPFFALAEKKLMNVPTCE